MQAYCLGSASGMRTGRAKALARPLSALARARLLLHVVMLSVFHEVPCLQQTLARAMFFFGQLSQDCLSIRRACCFSNMTRLGDCSCSNTWTSVTFSQGHLACN